MLPQRPLREAGKRGIAWVSVEVGVEGEFPCEGEPASRIAYAVRVTGAAAEAELLDLMAWKDRVTGIQSTIRRGFPRAEAVQVG